MLSLIENAGASQPAPRHFGEELALAQARLELLSGEYKRAVAAGKKIKGQMQTEMRVMNVLDDELRFVQEQHRKQREKVDQMKEEAERSQRNQDQLKSVIEPLLVEVEKLKLLAQGTGT
jgi:chromosome segregation ATPase